MQRWKTIKQEQKDYLASWKLIYKSEKSKEQGDLKKTGESKPGSSKDHRKRVPTPPPPPPRPDPNWPGTRAKAAPKRAPPQLKDQSNAGLEDFWFNQLTDDRRIGQASLTKERARGDPSGASRSAAPLLASNATASVPFNDKSLDHKLEVVPAFEAWPNQSPSPLEIHIAKCAAEVAKASGLGDNKGTLCFLEFMDLFEKELQ